MTDQELRQLSRADLIDIIYTLQQQKEQAEQQLAQAQAQLQDRQLRLASAGSIAEAALSLNGVFDAAQAAADQYLQAVGPPLPRRRRRRSRSLRTPSGRRRRSWIPRSVRLPSIGNDSSCRPDS